MINYSTPIWHTTPETPAEMAAALSLTTPMNPVNYWLQMHNNLLRTHAALHLVGMEHSPIHTRVIADLDYTETQLQKVLDSHWN